MQPPLYLPLCGVGNIAVDRIPGLPLDGSKKSRIIVLRRVHARISKQMLPAIEMHA
jgi:hypothetical protein